MFKTNRDKKDATLMADRIFLTHGLSFGIIMMEVWKSYH